MPLTIAHPVVAVPLRKAGLPLSPLIIGSIIPDFEFFLRLSTERLISHTYLGIFLFSIPVGLLALFLFHKVLKYPLLSFLPHHHQEKLMPLARGFTFFPAGRFFKIVLSLALGAVSHIALDSLTHGHGFPVSVMPWMTSELFDVPFGTVRVYFLLQYVISFVGIAMLFLWYLQWFRRAEQRHPRKVCRLTDGRKRAVAAVIAALTFAGGISYGFFSAPFLGDTSLVKDFVANTTVATVSSLIAVLVLFSVLWHWHGPTYAAEPVPEPITEQ